MTIRHVTAWMAGAVLLVILAPRLRAQTPADRLQPVDPVSMTSGAILPEPPRTPAPPQSAEQRERVLAALRAMRERVAALVDKQSTEPARRGIEPPAPTASEPGILGPM